MITDRGKQDDLETKSCPTKNPVQAALRLNPGLCGERPATTAWVMVRSVSDSNLLVLPTLVRHYYTEFHDKQS